MITRPIGLTSDARGEHGAIRARSSPEQVRHGGREHHQREQVAAHDPHQPGTGKRDEDAAHELAVEQVRGAQRDAADRELHQRFLADRRRPEEDARHEHDDDEVEPLVEERHRLDARAVPEVRPDERDQAEHDEARDHVGAEDVVHDTGEPAQEVALANVVEGRDDVRLAEPERGVAPAVDVEDRRVTDVAVGVHQRAVPQDRRDFLRDHCEHEEPGEPRLVEMPGREPLRGGDRGEDAEDRHEDAREDRRRERLRAQHQDQENHPGEHRGRHGQPGTAPGGGRRRRRRQSPASGKPDS